MAPKWVDSGRFLQQPLDQILGVSLLQNGSKNGPTGVVGFRICDDVAHFLSKLMFSLDVFFQIELSLEFWRGPKQNVR